MAKECTEAGRCCQPTGRAPPPLPPSMRLADVASPWPSGRDRMLGCAAACASWMPRYAMCHTFGVHSGVASSAFASPLPWCVPMPGSPCHPKHRTCRYYSGCLYVFGWQGGGREEPDTPRAYRQMLPVLTLEAVGVALTCSAKSRSHVVPGRPCMMNCHTRLQVLRTW